MSRDFFEEPADNALTAQDELPNDLAIPENASTTSQETQDEVSFSEKYGQVLKAIHEKKISKTRESIIAYLFSCPEGEPFFQLFLFWMNFNFTRRKRENHRETRIRRSYSWNQNFQRN